ncbi:hypothetical protein [Bacillus wiedmannii]|uniref:hypothetical protein n=1 Tax=Bacillus wiedmannii TaxID=1890302 RepID=UPI000BECCF62|nr:hypothetical protein [Bacillus wiedmannii]PDZ42318.1 hypothetical protein CON82_30320 [Bacillus wiedmannii]
MHRAIVNIFGFGAKILLRIFNNIENKTFEIQNGIADIYCDYLGDIRNYPYILTGFEVYTRTTYIGYYRNE